MLRLRMRRLMLCLGRRPLMSLWRPLRSHLLLRPWLRRCLWLRSSLLPHLRTQLNRGPLLWRRNLRLLSLLELRPLRLRLLSLLELRPLRLRLWRSMLLRSRLELRVPILRLLRNSRVHLILGLHRPDLVSALRKVLAALLLRPRSLRRTSATRNVLPLLPRIAEIGPFLWRLHALALRRPSDLRLSIARIHLPRRASTRTRSHRRCTRQLRRHPVVAYDGPCRDRLLRSAMVRAEELLPVLRRLVPHLRLRLHRRITLLMDRGNLCRARPRLVLRVRR